MWLKYFSNTPGLYPTGNLFEADVIVAAAFGRNTIPDKSLAAVNFIRKNHDSDFHAIKRLATDGFDPGKSNVDIADICFYLSEKLKLPVIVQWEIAAAFDLKWFELNQDNIHCVWPYPKTYFSTVDFVKEALLTMKEFSWRNPILIAHDYHISRVFMLFRKQQVSPIVTTFRINSFDKYSVQLWTRNFFLWQLREIIVRIHHFFKEHV